jgi:hypothetical protein
MVARRVNTKPVPEKEQPTQPPPILINGLRIAGEKQNISAIGETEIALPELDRDRDQLQIDFVGLSFESGKRFVISIESKALTPTGAHSLSSALSTSSTLRRADTGSSSAR